MTTNEASPPVVTTAPTATNAATDLPTETQLVKEEYLHRGKSADSYSSSSSVLSPTRRKTVASKQGTQLPLKWLKLRNDPYLTRIQKQITDVFSLFDNDNNNTIDKRDVGTVLRALNCCMSEGELLDIVKEVEEDESADYIHLSRFLNVATKILMEKKYQPAPEEKLLKAFQVLDHDKKGYLTTEEITKYFTQEGEPFIQEELEEMLSIAINPEKGVLIYKDFLPMLVVEDNE